MFTYYLFQRYTVAYLRYFKGSDMEYLIFDVSKLYDSITYTTTIFIKNNCCVLVYIIHIQILF